MGLPGSLPLLFDSTIFCCILCITLCGEWINCESVYPSVCPSICLSVCSSGSCLVVSRVRLCVCLQWRCVTPHGPATGSRMPRSRSVACVGVSWARCWSCITVVRAGAECATLARHSSDRFLRVAGITQSASATHASTNQMTDWFDRQTSFQRVNWVLKWSFVGFKPIESTIFRGR